MLTTIREFSEKTKIPVNSIRSLIRYNDIKPIDTEQYNIRGYRGKPFKIEEMENIITGFKPNEKQASEPIKKHSQKYVCEVLRKHVKSNLNNKLVKNWDYKDWVEFNKLIS